MNRDVHLEMVRTLSRPVVEGLCPARAEDFDDDFAAWVMAAGSQGVAEKLSRLTPPGQGLDTTLVAGMFFQVLLEASSLPDGPRERASFVRKQAKDYLVTRLAGAITMSQFYRLLNLIEEKAGYYFEHLDNSWTTPGALPGMTNAAAPPLAPATESVHGEDLRRALAALPLPEKGRRVTPETLGEFLRQTGGGWFRLLDLEARFQVNKKTAWTYLHLLLQGQILEHNGEKANRVRYALAPRFRA